MDGFALILSPEETEDNYLVVIATCGGAAWKCLGRSN